MSGLTEAQTRVGQIREKMETVKDMCDSVEKETVKCNSKARRIGNNDWDIIELDAGVMYWALQLYSCSDNSEDKKAIFSNLIDKLSCLVDAKMAQSKLMGYHDVHLENFYDRQVRFNKESCKLSVLLAEKIEATNKKHNRSAERLQQDERRQNETVTALEIKVRKLEHAIISNACICKVPPLPVDSPHQVSD